MTAGRQSYPPGTVVYAAVLGATVIGIVLIAVGPWRVGVSLCGVGFVVGGVARGVLGDGAAGLLRVRRRTFDVAWMVSLGAALAVLAVIVPRGY